VRVSGIHGGPRTPMLKVSIAYFWGYKAVGTLVYAWPEAYDKARAADAVLRHRLSDLGLEFDQILTEFVGVDATHGRLSGPPDPDIPEVQLRVGVRAHERAPVERFTREIAPLVLTGPPSVTGFAGGRPAVEEVVAYWPARIDRREIEPHVRVEILEACACPGPRSARPPGWFSSGTWRMPARATRATPRTSGSTRSSPSTIRFWSARGRRRGWRGTSGAW
jgi:hypothetical protein